MIGKITIGKSFRGCLLYCLNDKKQSEIKGRSEVLMYNKCYGNDKELVQQFNQVRQLNEKLSKPVMHITLSLAPGEKLGKDKLMELVEDCSRELGFDKNQFVAITHNDTDHQHIHIVANRVGLDKRTVSDSNNYQKIANCCRRMEIKYGLKQVLNPKKFLPKTQRVVPRQDQRKEHLKSHIGRSLKGCSNFQEFEKRMKAVGYGVIKGRGISFADEKKVIVKGSEVGYALQTIDRILQRQRALQLNLNIAAVRPGKLQEFDRSAQLERNTINMDLLEALTKSEKTTEPLDWHFLEKRRRKQENHSRHL